MKITNNKTGQVVKNKDCHGCICHSKKWRIHEDNIVNGCCTMCGCPYTQEGFEYYLTNIHRIRMDGAFCANKRIINANPQAK